MSVSIVWLAPTVAKIFHFSDDRMERTTFPLGAGIPDGLEILAEQLANSKKVLFVTPGGAPADYYLDRFRARFPEIAKRIVGNESLPDADDAAIAAYATQYFRKPRARAL
jgi:hypothetical protein